MEPAVSHSFDAIVVGSGPGGATVARELARAGKRVALLERGRDWRRSPLYGTYPGAMLYADRASFLFTREGLNVIRPLMLGGATSMYCGCAAPPPPWLKEKYDLDLERDAAEAMRELHIAPLPPELRGAASTRLAEAACALGMDWEPLPKFMNPARSAHFDCRATCMLGCRCGAKWNAAEWVDEAAALDCQVFTQARADDILIENRAAVGVRGRWSGQRFELRAPVIVLAAGGLGTPLLLKRAGIARAGEGMSMDTTMMVYGALRPGRGVRGNGYEPPMTYAWANDDPKEGGYMLSTLIDPWLNYPLVMGMKAPRYLLTWPRWGRTLGVMIKLKDDLSGGVKSERDIRKPFTASDQKKLDRAAALAKQILLRAGAEPDTLLATPMRGTHPCATVRIGEVLDHNLQTEIDNLHVCDASAFPEALARPTVLTIIALGKRLSRHLLASMS